VREGILGLRTSLGEEQGFIEVLRDYLVRWQAQSGVSVDLQTLPEDQFDPRLSPNGEVQLLRIIHEALTNVRKHAAAAKAQVRLNVSEGALSVHITDDGVGFEPEALGRATLPRFGLATMRERAEASGGSLRVSSMPGAGTQVAVRIPIESSSPRRGETVGARADR
jgi:signal transduction histidine kinase